MIIDEQYDFKQRKQKSMNRILITTCRNMPTYLCAGIGMLCVLVALPEIALAADKDKPNIVLILADDLGWTGVGCYGSEFYETPHIDKLATEGTRFTSAFSAAMNCAPSRATIMSGQYTPRHGILYVGPGTYQKRHKQKHGNLKEFKMIQPVGRTTFREGTETLAENLKQAGYRTAMYGKWHLGKEDQHPSKRGFDEAIESHGPHFDFKTDPKIEHNDDEYLSDFLSDQASSFIKTSAGSEQPFFLYFSDFLVHKPLEAKERYLKEFGDKPPSKHQKSVMAAAMIKSLDDSAGKILAALEESGEAENTLVIFTSDNGGLAYDEDGRKEANTSNHPLRGYKGTEYDGGTRVPWIVRWPGKTPADVECDETIHQVDLFTTLSKVGGAKPPSQTLDGVDLSNLFQSPDDGLEDREVFWYFPGYSAFNTPSVVARQGKWKLIRHLESEKTLLFNTVSDIGETTDVSSSNPELAETLNANAMQWLDETDAPRMTPNPEYVPKSRNGKNK